MIEFFKQIASQINIYECLTFAALNYFIVFGYKGATKGYSKNEIFHDVSKSFFLYATVKYLTFR